MTGLIFYYGAMGCSKTANALMTRAQYTEKGLQALLLKPATDSRADYIDKDDNYVSVVKSRIGLKAEDAVIVNKSYNIIELVYLNTGGKYDAIICDESQFFTSEQIEQLKQLSDDHIVLCYGLRTDFRTKLFPGSQRLLELADEIHSMDTVCGCGRKAIISARLDKQGKIVYDGDQVEIGGDDKYRSVCWNCWQAGKYSK